MTRAASSSPSAQKEKESMSQPAISTLDEFTARVNRTLTVAPGYLTGAMASSPRAFVDAEFAEAISLLAREPGSSEIESIRAQTEGLYESLRRLLCAPDTATFRGELSCTRQRYQAVATLIADLEACEDAAGNARRRRHIQFQTDYIRRWENLRHINDDRPPLKET
jgi:hypothetical protein